MEIKPLPFFYFTLGLHKFFAKKTSIDRTTSLEENNEVLSINDKEQGINNILIENKELIELVLRNGNSVLLSPSNFLYTQNGWKKASDISQKDMILNKVSLYQNDDKEKLPIGYKNNIKKRMPVLVPEFNNESFSEWIGLILAHGEFSSSGHITICLENESQIEYCKQLTKKAVNITPQIYIDKRSGNRLKELLFSSKNIVEFAESYLGKKYSIGARKIPSFIMEGNLKEQINFIKGVSFWAYRENGKVVAYRGRSMAVYNYISTTLRCMGYQVHQQSHNRNGITTYYVRIIGRYKKCYKINFYNQECMFINKKLSSDFLFYKGKFFQYRTLAKKHIEVDYNYYWTKIRKINLVGNKESVIVKVSNTNGLLYNNIVLGGTPTY